MLPNMRPSTWVALVLFSGASCSKATVVRSEPPACHVDPPEVVEEATPLGKLRASWRSAVKRELKTYDEVMTGVRPAYEGFSWLEGKRHGPVVGLIREDTIHGVAEQQLQLKGPINTAITIVRTTPRQAGAFLIQVPEGLIECSNCLDLKTLSLTDEMKFEGRKMVMLGVAPDGSQSRVPVDARVELRRLVPERITAETARTLFPVIAQSDRGALSVRPFTDVWIPVERPATVDARYGSCEAVLQKPPVVQIDAACLSNWKLEFESDLIATTCCTQPRYHGPSRSGHYPESCVPAPSVQ
jgi:hypothetical protein